MYAHTHVNAANGRERPAIMRRIPFLFSRWLTILSALVTLHAEASSAPSSTPGIASRGGASLSATNFPAAPYHRQADPRWADETLGASRERMAEIGCTVCCVSMALAQLGFRMDPGTLNASLRALDAYTASGDLSWRKAEQVVADAIAFELPESPSHAAIDAALRADRPVVAKIRRRETFPHWVLIVGKDDLEYLVKDPNSRTQEVQRLSSLSPRIESIRIVRRLDDAPEEPACHQAWTRVAARDGAR